MSPPSVLCDLLSTRLKEERIKRGLSQKDLAVIVDCSRSAISNYESGTNLPTVTQLLSLCLELGLSADYMLGLTDNPIV